MENNREQIIAEITALKMLLRDSDYEVTKYAEGLTDCTTQREIEAYREDFMAQHGALIASRKAWRARINELEEALDEADAAELEELEAEVDAEPEAEVETDETAASETDEQTGE